jgi:hypothetical protein
MLLCDIASLIRLSITIFVGRELPAHKIFRSVESLNPARSRFNNGDYSTAQTYASIRTSAAIALPPVSKLDMFPKAHCKKSFRRVNWLLWLIYGTNSCRECHNQEGSRQEMSIE